MGEKARTPRLYSMWLEEVEAQYRNLIFYANTNKSLTYLLGALLHCHFRLPEPYIHFRDFAVESRSALYYNYDREVGSMARC